MRLAHPLSRLLAVIPHVLGVGQHTREPLGAFALIDGELFAAAFPGSLWDDFELVGAGDPTVIGYFTPTFDNARTDFRVTWVCPKGAENWLVNVTVTMGFSHVDQLPAVRCDARHATLSAKLPSNLDGDPNVYAVVEAQANVCQTRQLLIDAKMAIPGSYSTRLSGTQARKDERVVVIHFKETGLWGVNTSDWEKGENSDLPTLVTENDRNSRRMAIPASSFSGRCPTAINVWHGNDGKGKSIWIADLVH